MNNDKPSYFVTRPEGCAVFHDGHEVADKLTQEQAGQLLDDLSYYGSPMYCAYNRKELCMQGTAICLRCPYRKEMEDGRHA